MNSNNNNDNQNVGISAQSNKLNPVFMATFQSGSSLCREDEEGDSEESFVDELDIYLRIRHTRSELKRFHDNPMEFFGNHELMKFYGIERLGRYARHILIKKPSECASEFMFSMAGKGFMKRFRTKDEKREAQMKAHCNRARNGKFKHK